MTKPRAFCEYCGSPYLPDARWPRKCGSPSCGEMRWVNPTPVAVLIIRLVAPDVDNDALVLRRANEPSKGKWAFPGGFIELGESWRRAMVRETMEEVGVEVPEDGIDLFDVHSVDDGARILIFGITRNRHYVDLDAINRRLRETPNEEVYEVGRSRDHHDLAFPTHSKVLQRYLGRT